ncbi:MAG: Holliday junction resolvase RuvX [Nannocystaceae bacterium]
MPTNSAQTPKYTRALGLDVGSKTIGLAMTDASGAIASARDVLRRRGEKHDVEAVSAICTKEQISKIVIGLPLELDGSVGHRARRVRRFARALIAAVGETPVVLWDERFSTAAAKRTLLAVDASRAQQKATVDALAAQFFLQGWVDAGAPAGEGL